MSIPRCLKKPSLLVALVTTWTLSTAAAANCLNPEPDALTPDVVAEFVNSARIENGVVNFAIKLTNCGASMDEVYTMFSKPVLVPKKNYAAQLVGQGLVLETFPVDLNLAHGQSVNVVVDANMPNIPAGDYFLAVTINTKAAPIPTVGEGEGFAFNLNPMLMQKKLDQFSLTSALQAYKRPVIRSQKVTLKYANNEFVPETIAAQINNVTERMLDLGSLESYVGRQWTGKYDLYHEVVNAKFNFGTNTAMHGSRNILRIMEGQDQIPDPATWETTVSARFLFFSLEQGTAHLGPYTSQSIDKVWTAISWSPEVDRAGRNIHVDYYSNAPYVNHLTPGRYVLGVLMNVTDRFTLDSFPENNLDLTYVEVPQVGNLNVSKEVWLNLGSETSTSLWASVNKPIDNQSWSIEVANKPEWLNITESKYDYGYVVEFSVADTSPHGVFDFNVTVSAVVDGVRQSVPSKLKIIKPSGPIVRWYGTGNDSILKPDSPGVRLEDRDGVRYLHIKFELANVGNLPMIYQFEPHTGVVFNTPAVRVVNPGDRHEITTTVPLVGISLPREGNPRSLGLSASVLTNSGRQYLSVNFDAKAMIEHK